MRPEVVMPLWLLLAACGLTPYTDLTPSPADSDVADDEAPVDDTPDDDPPPAGDDSDDARDPDDTPRDTEAPDPPAPPAFTGPCPVLVEMTTLAYGIESGWRVLNAGGGLVAGDAPGTLADNQSYVAFLDVSDGGFQVEAIDSYGDGWHGGGLRVVSEQGQVLASVTLQTGQTSAFTPFTVDCLQPPPNPRTCPVRVIVETENWASESGWKLLDDAGTTLSTVPSGTYANYQSYTHDADLAEGVYVYEATDRYGDGWHGGTFTVRVNGQQVRTGTLTDGFSSRFVFPVACP